MNKGGSKQSQAVAILAILSIVTGCSTGHTFKLKNGGVLSIKKDNTGCGEMSEWGISDCFYGGTIKMPSGKILDSSAEFSCTYTTEKLWSVKGDKIPGRTLGNFDGSSPYGYDQICKLFERWDMFPPRGTILKPVS